MRGDAECEEFMDAHAEVAVEMADTADRLCGGDEAYVAQGYFHVMSDAVEGTPYPLRLIFAIDVLRRAKRTIH